MKCDNQRYRTMNNANKPKIIKIYHTASIRSANNRVVSAVCTQIMKNPKSNMFSLEDKFEEEKIPHTEDKASPICQN